MNVFPSTPPQYSDNTLKRILNDCKTIDEICHVGKIMKELSEAGDFTISHKVKAFVLVKQQELIYKNKNNKP
ncbi:MAG TPA: hypothetical protein DIW37_05385 [Chryseobacterium sp.]|nr:hypothetical protein [Chryseobacterium sp.]